jgi:carnitine O-acetyltransferase
MQFTVTSRKEMPNREFCVELERAAEDMHALFAGQNATQVKAKL